MYIPETPRLDDYDHLIELLEKLDELDEGLGYSSVSDWITRLESNDSLSSREAERQ